MLNIEYERTPNWLRWMIPFLRWKMPSSTNKVYLTFDDGPTEGVTDQILGLLREHQAVATFFMLGRQVVRSPKIAENVIKEGHSIGNHGYEHLSGWRTGVTRYISDARQGQHQISNALNIHTKLFRPAYGQLGVMQGICLWWLYRIIMWDVVSMDYRTDLYTEDVIEITCRHARAGSIILMHDSELSAPRIIPALPKIIESIRCQGLEFGKL